MTGTRTWDVRGRTRHGVMGTMLATLMLAGQAGAQVAGCHWTASAFWDDAALPAVERCIAAGANVNARGPFEWTPLHMAASYGTAEAVQALIDAGADVNAQDRDGKLPADFAEHNEAVRNHDVFLMLAGAQVAVCNWTGLAFWYGAGLPDVERCIATGADIGAGTLIEGTPLHWAAALGTAGSVQALIAAGADIEARTENGRTPLHVAAYDGTAETVQALIEAGADIRARDEDGLLAVDLAEDNEAVRNHDVFWTLKEARIVY